MNANEKGGNAALRTTRWTLVRRALGGGADLDDWAASCWHPLYAWARRWGQSPEDAADAVQEFLGKICANGLLAQADPARGRFRLWLLTGFRNHLASAQAAATRLKRGGRTKPLPLDLDHLEALYASDMTGADDPDRAYTRAWALSLMDEALVRLEKHYRDSGRGEWFEALLPALEEAMPAGLSEQLAPRFGLSTNALRQAAHRFRLRYRGFLLEVAAERLGITSEARLAEELREMLLD